MSPKLTAKPSISVMVKRLGLEWKDCYYYYYYSLFFVVIIQSFIRRQPSKGSVTR